MKKADDAADDDDMDVDLDMDDEMEPDVVALLPVTSYEALLKNFSVKPGAAGSIDQVAMPDGNDGFLKDVGNGYAAFSSSKELLAKFDAKSGAGAIKGKLGKAGEALSDSSDIVTIVNMDVVRPLWPEIKKEMKEGIAEGAANLPMGEAPNPMENPAIEWLGEMVVRDSRALVGGFRTGNTGVSLDFAVNFTEGTQLAKVFSSPGKAGALMGKLPDTLFLLAGAIDLSGAEMKSFIKEFAAKGADITKSLGMETSVKRLQATEGASFVMGVPAGGIFGGLLTSTLSFSATKDVPAFVAMQQEELTALNGKEQEGFTLESSYKPAASKVEGVDVDEYAVKFKVDPNSEAAEAAPQALNAIFGPTGGPAGYIAKTDGGVFQTFGRNTGTAHQRPQGGQRRTRVGADQMITQVGAAMPANRSAELYVGMKGLLDLIVPAAAMFTGVQIEPDLIPATLPPVGLALANNNGAAHFSVFVPAPVIKTATKIGLTVQQQMEGGFGEGEGEDEAAPADGGKGGTGQPRF